MEEHKIEHNRCFSTTYSSSSLTKYPHFNKDSFKADNRTTFKQDLSSKDHSEHAPLFGYAKSNTEQSSTMQKSRPKVTTLHPIHALNGASQLFIVAWETNNFKTHFQAKNYRNDP
ncbi:MAG: hypothetical protein ACRCSY_03850 [Cetobacterium sp.]